MAQPAGDADPEAADRHRRDGHDRQPDDRRPAAADHRDGDRRGRKAAEQLMRAIAALLPEEYRGVYA